MAAIQPSSSISTSKHLLPTASSSSSPSPSGKLSTTSHRSLKPPSSSAFHLQNNKPSILKGTTNSKQPATLRELIKSREELGKIPVPSWCCYPTRYFGDVAVRESAGNQYHYVRSLKGHFGCVNAIAYNSSGDILASGGDDQRVLLWQANTITKEQKFMANFFGHERPSGAPSEAAEIVEAHEAAVIKFSIKPGTNDVVMSCGGVMFNPVMPELFVTCEDGGRILLRDLRMCFSSTQKHVVRYNTTLTRGERCAKSPDITSAVFSPCGTLVGAVLQRWRPVIYSIDDPIPIATLRSQTDGILYNGDLNESQRVANTAGRMILRRRGYSSVCTLKTAAFGERGVGYFGKGSVMVGDSLGDEDHDGMFGGNSNTQESRRPVRYQYPGSQTQLFGVGSDDFRAYVWEVPSAKVLKASRKIVNRFEDQEFDDSVVSFWSKDGSKVVPVELNQEAFSLEGHRSIVNSISFHPRLPMIATAGVEKLVRVFSPWEFSDHAPNELKTNQLEPRLQNETGRRVMFGFDFPDEEEDTATLANFDHILVQEGSVDSLWNDEEDSSDEWTTTTEDSSADSSDDSGVEETTRAVPPTTRSSRRAAAMAGITSTESHEYHDERSNDRVGLPYQTPTEMNLSHPPQSDDEDEEENEIEEEMMADEEDYVLEIAFGPVSGNDESRLQESMNRIAETLGDAVSTEDRSMRRLVQRRRRLERMRRRRQERLAREAAGNDDDDEVGE
ncbi:hypothetical protein HDU76_005942, partial [Blyttiomyces sp. JEL0837]